MHILIFYSIRASCEKRAKVFTRLRANAVKYVT